MYIAGNIINKHGGNIHLERTVGKGTMFVIQLPVASDADCGGQSSPGQPAAS